MSSDKKKQNIQKPSFIFKKKILSDHIGIFWLKIILSLEYNSVGECLFSM